ncbi:MAG: hypothetical protein ACE5JH_08245 [Acidobacteriota bacterium]
MSRSSRTWLLSWTLALAGAAAACGGRSTEVAERTSPEAEEAVFEEDLPAPPAPEPSGVKSRPQRMAGTVPEERSGALTPPRPATVTLVVPQGTVLEGTFAAPLSSQNATVGDEVVVRLTHPIVAGERVAFPEGSLLHGKVTDVKPAKKGFKNTSGALAVAFDRLVRPDGRQATVAAGFTMVAEGSGKKKAAIIGGSAAGGAILGKVLEKDSAGAALIGGAIGTAVAGATKGKEAIIAEGDPIAVTLESPARVIVRR